MVLFLFGFVKLIEVIVLLLNAICILSEDRFLARVGWVRSSQDAGFGATHDSASIQARGVEFVKSVRTVARVPLIGVNAFIIVYELLAG